MLADLGSTHPQLLHPVTVREERVHADLAVLRVRENLVGVRTKLVNAARGLAKSLGHELPHCSTESFPRKASKDCPEALGPSLRLLFVAIAIPGATITLAMTNNLWASLNPAGWIELMSAFGWPYFAVAAMCALYQLGGANAQAASRIAGANARTSGYMGAANAITGGINNYQQSQLLSQLLRQYGA